MDTATLRLEKTRLAWSHSTEKAAVERQRNLQLFATALGLIATGVGAAGFDKLPATPALLLIVAGAALAAWAQLRLRATERSLRLQLYVAFDSIERLIAEGASS